MNVLFSSLSYKRIIAGSELVLLQIAWLTLKPFEHQFECKVFKKLNIFNVM